MHLVGFTIEIINFNVISLRWRPFNVQVLAYEHDRLQMIDPLRNLRIFGMFNLPCKSTARSLNLVGTPSGGFESGE